MERSGTKTTFHYLGILRWNGTNFALHCLKSEWNGIDYNIFIPLLPLYNYYLKLKQVNLKILFSWI